MAAKTGEKEQKSEESTSFDDFGLDGRLLKAIRQLGWDRPTLIQAEAIPLALEGNDILARARTGSGKTGAYAIPLVQKLLESKLSLDDVQGTKALILAPSKELCQQTTLNLKDLCACCTKDLRIVDVASAGSVSSQRSALSEKPDIVVATPGRALAHMQSKTLDVRETLQLLVIDEADLTFSYGFEEDLKKIAPFLPQICQTFLMSATLSADVKSIKALMLHNPVTLKLEEGDLPSLEQLTQYHVKCEKDDKYLLIFAMLKLELIQGKSLIFVNSINSCYKLKLFLEQFGILSCVLNSELPYNSRQHIVDEFNRGVYDYIIATDEIESLAAQRKASQPPGKLKSKQKKDKSYGVSRGIDFQGVENVLNFDFPPSVDAYVHRVGRTARGTEVGLSLSFVSEAEMGGLREVETRLTGGAVNDTPVAVKPYKFKMSEIDGFRYRVKDALKAMSRSAVREARLKAIKAEVLNSDKLKTFFQDNPRDLQVLRHDRTLQPKKIQPHLKQVPSYLIPSVLRKAIEERQAEDQPLAKRKKTSSQQVRPTRGGGGARRGGGGARRGRGKKPMDPLIAYAASKKL